MSIFVALVAALNGWIICWGATDWFGALGAFAWFPWAWWGLERALDPQRIRWRFLWPAPFVYLVVTGGFPYTVLMLVLLIAWLCLRSLIQTRTLLSILPLLFGAALGFGLSAPAWLAAFAYVHGSARELQPSSAHWQWLVPPTALPGFILPCWKVNWADFSTHMMPHAATELSCGFVALTAITMSILHTNGPNAFRLTWIFLGLSLLWAVPEFFSGQSRQLLGWTPACVTFAAFVATYFCLPLNCGVPKYNLDPQLLEAAPLDRQRLYLSIYPAAEHTY